MFLLIHGGVAIAFVEVAAWDNCLLHSRSMLASLSFAKTLANQRGADRRATMKELLMRCNVVVAALLRYSAHHKRVVRDALF